MIYEVYKQSTYVKSLSNSIVCMAPTRVCNNHIIMSQLVYFDPTCSTTLQGILDTCTFDDRPREEDGKPEGKPCCPKNNVRQSLTKPIYSLKKFTATLR